MEDVSTYINSPEKISNLNDYQRSALTVTVAEYISVVDVEIDDLINLFKYLAKQYPHMLMSIFQITRDVSKFELLSDAAMDHDVIGDVVNAVSGYVIELEETIPEKEEDEEESSIFI